MTLLLKQSFLTRRKRTQHSFLPKKLLLFSHRIKSPSIAVVQFFWFTLKRLIPSISRWLKERSTCFHMFLHWSLKSTRSSIYFHLIDERYIGVVKKRTPSGSIIRVLNSNSKISCLNFRCNYRNGSKISLHWGKSIISLHMFQILWLLTWQIALRKRIRI